VTSTSNLGFLCHSLEPVPSFILQNHSTSKPYHTFTKKHMLSATQHRSRLEADSTVNTALDEKLLRESEWSRKNSIAVYSEDHYQQASASCDQVDNSQQLITTMKRKVKDNINEEFSSMWHDHVKSLTVQGNFLDLLHVENSHITWRSLIYNLPRGILKFAINASIDTLATNAYLKRWGKCRNARCDLCGGRETLHHVHLPPRKILLETQLYIKVSDRTNFI
jgi:hypothetical protein